jgi:DegV family protein with EDD domain
MSQYVLTCCSTADLPKEHFEKRNIHYTCFHFTMDGKEYADDLGESMSFKEFYSRMSAGATPTTSQVNVDQMLEFFESFLKQGMDVLHVTLSSGLSGVHNSARVAQETLQSKYPDRKIAVVDSLGASSGYGLLMDLAADLRDSGAGFDQVHSWLEENKLNIHHWFFSTDLTSYYRGGRITKTAHLFGSMLNICPLLNMDHLGRLIPRSKYRGKKQVIREIVKRMQAHAKDGLQYSGKCFISNSDCYEDARTVADLVEAAFPKLAAPVMINSVGTVIGSHTGPGTVALFFVGDKRTE